MTAVGTLLSREMFKRKPVYIAIDRDFNNRGNLIFRRQLGLSSPFTRMRGMKSGKENPILKKVLLIGVNHA